MNIKKWGNRVIRGAMLFALIVVGPAFAQAGDLAEIKARGELRHLGIPYANFVTGAGDGLDVELMKLFAGHLGVKYTFVQTDWGHVIGDLTGKKVKPIGTEVEIVGQLPVKGDVIANGLTILPWRQKVLDFSRPTFPTQVWLVAKADSPVEPIKPSGDIEQDIELTKKVLKGRKIFDVPNTCLDAGLYNLSEKGPVVEHFKGGLNDIAPAVIGGKAEMTLLDVPDALVALERFPQELKVIGPLSEKQGMGVGFPQTSPELQNEFASFFDGIWAKEIYLELIKKYYPAVLAYFPQFFK